jgi:hypothetical protein
MSTNQMAGFLLEVQENLHLPGSLDFPCIYTLCNYVENKFDIFITNIEKVLTCRESWIIFIQ